MTNHLPDRNRFKLAAPPVWWLRSLAEFDRSLVVIPSRVEAVYWIAQRRPMLEVDHGKQFISPDEFMMRSHNLIAVTKLLSLTGAWNWSTNIFPQLAARAGWRNGLTPSQSAALTDRHDIDERKQRHARRDDRLDHQIRHAESIAKWHTGRTILAPGRPQGTVEDRLSALARSAQRAPSEPSSGRTQPSDA